MTTDGNIRRDMTIGEMTIDYRHDEVEERSKRGRSKKEARSKKEGSKKEGRSKIEGSKNEGRSKIEGNKKQREGHGLLRTAMMLLMLLMGGMMNGAWAANKQVTFSLTFSKFTFTAPYVSGSTTQTVTKAVTVDDTKEILETFPVDMRRQFCLYKFYTDASKNYGDEGEVTSYDGVASGATIYATFIVDPKAPIQYSDWGNNPEWFATRSNANWYLLKVGKYYLNYINNPRSNDYYVDQCMKKLADIPDDGVTDGMQWAFVGNPYATLVICKACYDGDYKRGHLTRAGRDNTAGTKVWVRDGDASVKKDDGSGSVQWEIKYYRRETWNENTTVYNYSDPNLFTLSRFNPEMNTGRDRLYLQHTEDANDPCPWIYNTAEENKAAIQAIPLGNTFHICNKDNEVVMEYRLPFTSDRLAELPDNLKRGFCSYVYYTSQLEMESGENGHTALSDLSLASHGDIWVKYTVNMPFKTLGSMSEVDTSDDSQWYAIKTDADQDKYSGSYAYKNGNNFNSVWALDSADPKYMYTFVGDPYSLKIVNRENTAYTLHPGTSWESSDVSASFSDSDKLPNEWAIDGDTDGTRFRLFVADSYEAPYYLYPVSSDGNVRTGLYMSGNFLKTKSGQSRTTAQLLEVGRVYTFTIVNRSGNVATRFSRTIRASQREMTLTELMVDENADYRSPLATNYKFYLGDGAQERAHQNTTVSDVTMPTQLPDANTVVYIGYDVAANPALNLDGQQEYYIVGGSDSYLYFNPSETGNNKIWLHQITTTNYEADLPTAYWTLNGKPDGGTVLDPYNVKFCQGDTWAAARKDDISIRTMLSESNDTYCDRFMIMNDPTGGSQYRVMLSRTNVMYHYSLYRLWENSQWESFYLDEQYHDAKGRRSMKIFPRNPYIYHVVNLSGDEAITAKVYNPNMPHEQFEPETPDVIKAYGISSYSYYKLVDGEYVTLSSVTPGVDPQDIYVKYTVDATKMKGKFDGTRLFDIKIGDRHLRYELDKETFGTDYGGATNQFKHLWNVLPNKVDTSFDPYDVTIYNIQNDVSPLGTSTMTTTDGTYGLNIGSATNSTYILQGTDGSKFALLVANSFSSDGATYAYLAHKNNAPYIIRSADLQYSGSSTDLGNKSKEPMKITFVFKTPNFYYHVYNLRNENVLNVQLTDALALQTKVNVPECIKSPLVEEQDWKFWKSASFTSENAATKLTDLTEATNKDSSIDFHVYISYDYAANSDAMVDLTGEVYYNINFVKPDGENEEANYWVTTSDQISTNYAPHKYRKAIKAYTLDAAKKVNGQYELLDDEALWRFTGADPYDIVLLSYTGDVAQWAITETVMNPRVSLSHTSDMSEARHFALVKNGTDYDLLLTRNLNKDETSENPIIYKVGDSGWICDKAYRNSKGEIELSSVATNTSKTMIHLTPRSSDYVYHIINHVNRKALAYSGKGVSGKPAGDLPQAVRSPMADNFRFYSKDDVTGMEDGVYTEPDRSRAMEVMPTVTVGETEDIYVFYDTRTTAVDDADLLDLSPNAETGAFYFMAAASKYIRDNDGAGEGQVTADKDVPEHERYKVDDYLWRLEGDDLGDGVGDPYNVHLRPKDYNTMLTADGFDDGTNDLMLTSDTDGVQAFCLLPGNGVRSNYAVVAASGDEITDNRFAYVSRGTDGHLQLSRGDKVNGMSSDVQVRIEIPTFKYTYRVVNLSDQIAIQHTELQETGTAPHLPTAISSPFIDADKTYYYEEDQMMESGGKYTVIGTQPSSTLPYYNATLYTLYQFAENPALNIQGKSYNVTLGGQYLQATGSNTLTFSTTAPTAAATTSYMFAPTGNIGTDDAPLIDPYNITLTGYDATTAYKASPYVVMKGNADGKWVMMKATGKVTDPDEDDTVHQYMTYDGSTASLQADATADGAQLVFTPIKVKATYVVINKNQRQSIRYTVDAEGGDVPVIPRQIKSALLDYADFHYWKPDGWKWVKPNETLETATTAADPLNEKQDGPSMDNNNLFARSKNWYGCADPKPCKALNYTDGVVYVNYDRSDYDLDLSGRAFFNLHKDTLGVDSYFYKPSTFTETHGRDGTESGTPSFTQEQWLKKYPSATTENREAIEREVGNMDYVIVLSGGDPYDIHIQLGAFQKDDKGTERWLGNDASGNGMNTDQTACMRFGDAGTTGARTHGQSFTLIENDNGKEGDYQLLFNYVTKAGENYYRIAHTYENSTDQGFRIVRTNVETKYSKSQFNLTLTPKNMVDVEFTLERKITGEIMSVTERHAGLGSIDVPTSWKRSFIKQYIYHCDYDEAGAAADITTNTLMRYPLMDYKLDDNGKPIIPTIHIQVDYEVDELPFTPLANTKEGVANVLAGKTADGSADLTTLFDQNDYDHRQKNKSHLYFMVMRTNNASSSRETPQFLRREDSNRISWLDNDYRLWPDEKGADSRNVNHWNWSRCAESYRINDHNIFQEKNWLWAFAGDPYDLYVYNMSAVVEDKYNTVTEEVEATTYHTDHLTALTTVEKTSGTKTTTEMVVSTPAYSETAAVAPFSWGIAPGQGTDSDQTFSLMTTDADNHLVYWHMASSKVENNATEVLLEQRSNTTSLDYNIRVLPYEPQKYEDVDIVIRRTDDKDGTQGSGVSELYYASRDRVFVAGDMIYRHVMESGKCHAGDDCTQAYIDKWGDKKSIPMMAMRQFCKYTIYMDKFETPGDYTIEEGSYLDSDGRVKDKDGNYLDENGNVTTDATKAWVVEDDQVKEGVWPTSVVYATYEVTSPVFLRKEPTEAEMKAMVDKNDHVYFMDFIRSQKRGEPGYNTGHHAYFSEGTTFGYKNEKRAWTGTGFADKSQAAGSNDCEYKTTSNRMNSVPENLKWFFVGDPYHVRVYCTSKYTDDNRAQLRRFIPEESAYQFVVDCVHLRKAEADNSYTDTRDYLTYYNMDGSEMKDANGNTVTIKNDKKGKSYYPDFTWEVVPSVNTDYEDEAFALRFKDNTPILGYRNVYYYLAHDGLKKNYDTSQSYSVNLSYDPENARTLNGKYIGFHSANNESTVIRLVQPVKLYVSAYKESIAAENLKAREELTEYFGLGETLSDIPRHLKRKYVSYSPSTYALTEANNPTSETDTHTSGDVYVTEGQKANYEFKWSTAYTMNDLTKTKDGKEVHLFSSDIASATWLDVMVGNYHWLYYDKVNHKNDGSFVSDYHDYSSNNPKDNNIGWNTGLKGLHWAFIGDPYDFTAVNRRRLEIKDNSDNLDNSYNLAFTEETLNGYTGKNDSIVQRMVLSETASHFGIVYGKTDTDTSYGLLRTASLKTSEGDKANEYSYRTPDASDGNTYNQTNNYWRFTSNGATSLNSPAYHFTGVPFSLSTPVNSMPKVVIRTATLQDDDDADNNCFDADVYVVPKSAVAGLDLTNKAAVAAAAKAFKENAEVKYGDPFDNMPQTLRRYGCNYTACYVNGTATEYFGESMAGSASGNALIVYAYELTAEAEKFFTSPDDASQDAYTWANANFDWQQSYQGTNVRVVEYEDVFDHYVYNASGHIIDEVWTKREKVTYRSGTIWTDGYGWLNTHTGETGAYGDERTQSKSDDRQKWAFVGDPYDFKLKNYAQYLVNPSSALSVGSDATGTAVSSSNISSEQASWTLMQGSQKTKMVEGSNGRYVETPIYLDDKGKETTVKTDTPAYDYYLALIDAQGNILRYVTFDRTQNNKDLDAKDQYLYLSGSIGMDGVASNDPTGNLYNVNGVRPFSLADLLSYASLVTYHLVIAHQHSLDYQDKDLPLVSENGSYTVITTAKKKEIAEAINSHLKEYLTYKNKAYLDYIELKTHTDGFQYYDFTSAATKQQQDDLKALMKKASLRDFVSYPIEDYSVSSVGIGNRFSVPWYMKRQFCTYKMYLKDIKYSQRTGEPEEADADWIANGGATKEVTYNGRTYTAKVDSRGNVLEIDKWTSVSEDQAGHAAAYNYLKDNQGKEVTKIDVSMDNRRVEVDVVYEVNTDQFRFADRGRNTTAWYQMMTENDQDGLMNFSYKNGVGARLDRTHHYTNNYLWAPQGDPYGFVMRSRYATINGTGWDDVVVTTKGALPKQDNKAADGTAFSRTADETGKVPMYQATYTSKQQEADGLAKFVDDRVVHFLKGAYRTDGTLVATDGAANAIYEMFVGNEAGSFLMHPTSAWIDISTDNFRSYYMVHDTEGFVAKVEEHSAKDILNNKDANWHMETTAEQLLPYFKRAGYVGGLNPTIANHFDNIAIYNRLQEYVADPTKARDYSVLNKARELVYAGEFHKVSDTGADLGVVDYIDGRPTERMRFEPTNLLNMTQGYYRIRAFSEEALNADGEDLLGNNSKSLRGVVGPRYISGYRFESEKKDQNDAQNTGGRWLHFFETDAAHSTIHDFKTLKSKITEANAGGVKDRDIFDHTAMAGNIEILPVEYDPSSIFYFAPVSEDRFDRYTVSTQGLELHARPGGTEGTDANFGKTELKDLDAAVEAGYSTKFRIADIGGTAVTLRTLDTETGNWDDLVEKNIKTNYVCIDRNHRYRITCHKDNEMVEIGDHYDEHGTNGVQDTKWLLEPIGVQTDWPYNQVPLRLEVHKGGVKDASLTDATGLKDASNADTNYYGSLYVPFDTRLGNTTDVAFTLTGTPADDATTLRLASVSQINQMGNPQYIPAEWPVIVRSAENQVKKTALYKENGSKYRDVNYVNLYLPYTSPQTVDKKDLNANLRGRYLEQTLGDGTAEGKVMVFGLPYQDHAVDRSDANQDHHVYDQYGRVGFYKNDNWAREDFSGYTAATATDAQRKNLYVYHNKVYYVDGGSGTRAFVDVWFEGDLEPEDEPIENGVTERQPWPCAVYDLQGRKVADNETPETLRRNHPALRKGVYIFGGRKVVVK